MSCCSPIDARPGEKTGTCTTCGADVDIDGESVEEGCTYSPACKECGDCPCDMSC